MLFAFWQTGHDESGWLEESWTCFTMSRYKINSIHQTFVGCQTLNPKKTAAGHSNGAPVSPAAPGAGLVQQRSQEMGMDHARDGDGSCNTILFEVNRTRVNWPAKLEVQWFWGFFVPILIPFQSLRWRHVESSQNCWWGLFPQCGSENASAP